MNDDKAEQGGTELIETDSMVVVVGQQASPPTMSLNGGAEEQERATIPGAGLVMEFQNDLYDHGEEQCRICFSPGTEERPLYYPCACNGSIKFMHEDCLLQWLKVKSTKQCEICKHEFALRYEYAPNTPFRLPWVEVICEVAMKAGRWTRSLTWGELILSLVFLIICLFGLYVLLFVILTMMTCLWRLIFFESLSDLVDSSPNLHVLHVHWFYGLSPLRKLVSGLVIVLIFKYCSDMDFDQVWELWLQRERAIRQRIVEVLYRRPGHIGVLNRQLTQLIALVCTWLLIALHVGHRLAFALWKSTSLGYCLVHNPAVDPAYGWLAFLGVVALWYLGKWMNQWLSDLHDSIRDDKYLIGIRVEISRQRRTN